MGRNNAGRIWNDAFSQYIRGSIIFWRLEYANPECVDAEVGRMDERSARDDSLNPLGDFLVVE